MRIPQSMLIEEGAMFPRRWGWPWGMAWRDHSTLRAVVLPVPLHLVVGAVRRLYFAILHGVHPHKLEKARSLVDYYQSNSQSYEREWRAARDRAEALDLAQKRAVRMCATMAKECDRMRGLLRIAGIYPEPPA